MLWLSLLAGILAVAAAFAVFGYYRWRSYREFGGITGDTAGYFLTLCEGAMAVAAARVSVDLKKSRYWCKKDDELGYT